MSGREVTGEVIANVVEKYSAAINAKDGILTELSQLPTQRQMVIKLSGERAVKSAVNVYQSMMSETRQAMPVEEKTLALAHAKAFEDALKVFKQEALIDDEAKMDE